MSKAFCFTLNNYTDQEVELVKSLCPLKFSYLVFGFEKGDEEGTPHLQGYFELPKQMKWSTLINLFNKRVHLGLRIGTQKDAINYCKKGEQTHSEWHSHKEKGKNWGLNAVVYESGKPDEKHQGKRSDLDIIRSVAKVGGMRKVVKVAKNYQAIQVAGKYLEYNEPVRDFKPRVIFIYGKARTGKSRRAREYISKYSSLDDYYTKNDGTKWWIGYDAHDGLIIDDFRDSWWSITEMLSLLDRYEKRVETKGGSRQLLSRTIIITSIHHPSRLYSGCCDEPIEQLLGRIDEIINHTIDYYPDLNPNKPYPDFPVLK